MDSKGQEQDLYLLRPQALLVTLALGPQSHSSLLTPLQGSSFEKSPILSLVLCALMKPSQSQGAPGGTAIQKTGGLKQSFLLCVLRVNGVWQLLDQAPAVPGCTKQSQLWLSLSFRLV